MMKKAIAIILLFAFLPLQGAFCVETKSVLPALYTGKLRLSAKVFRAVDGTEGIDAFATIPNKVRITIHALDPSFALVTYEADHVTGYIRRLCIEDPKVIDSSATPPYGVCFNEFVVEITAEDAPIVSCASSHETLITLHRGAWLSLLGFENGYAKVIYHREYAYIDPVNISEPIQVCSQAELAKADELIASYTSFYKITTDESNQNRITNIHVACGKLEEIVLQPGDTLDFNANIGPYRASNGYMPATVLVDGEAKQGYGGGTCQVSSTLYNVVLQLPGLTVLQRRAHGDNGASYLPIAMDAAVGSSTLNFKFRNDYDFPISFRTGVQDGALTMAIYRVGE